jgi:hypothetical protein
MIPKGRAWQELRQRGLGTVPEKTHFPYDHPITISRWMEKGSFVVTNVVGSRYTISAAHNELGVALLSEASYFLDSAAEHSVSIRNQFNSNTWFSPAWLCVTFYYWVFFIILSITRLIGSTPLFVSSDRIKLLDSFSSGTNRSPGAGTYIMKCEKAQNIGLADVELKKPSSSRLHDVIWRNFFKEIRNLYKLTIGGGQKEEERLFISIKKSADILGDTWPSDLRNMLNYHPGKGYLSVRKDHTIKAFSNFMYDPALNFEKSLGRLEGNVASLRKETGVQGDPSAAVRVLMDVTFSLDVIANELYSEIVDARNINNRWVRARNEFFRREFSEYKDEKWPFGTGE